MLFKGLHYHIPRVKGIFIFSHSLSARIEWVVVLPVWGQVYTEWEEGLFTVSEEARAIMKETSLLNHSKHLGSSETE